MPIPISTSPENVFITASALLSNSKLRAAMVKIALTRFSKAELQTFLDELQSQVILDELVEAETSITDTIEDTLAQYRPRVKLDLRSAKPNPIIYLRWDSSTEDNTPLYVGPLHFAKEGYYQITDPNTTERQIVYSAGGTNCIAIDESRPIQEIIDRVKSKNPVTGLTLWLEQLYPNEKRIGYEFPDQTSELFAWRRRPIKFISADKQAIEAWLNRLPEKTREVSSSKPSDLTSSQIIKPRPKNVIKPPQNHPKKT